MCVFVLSSSKFSAKKGNERCAYIVSITEANISSFLAGCEGGKESKRIVLIFYLTDQIILFIQYIIILFYIKMMMMMIMSFIFCACLPACVCICLADLHMYAHCERAINDRTLTYYFLHVMTGVQARNFSQNVQGMHKKWVNLFRRYWDTKVSLARFIESCFSKAKSLSLCISNIVVHDDRNQSIIWLHAKNWKRRSILSYLKL